MKSYDKIIPNSQMLMHLPLTEGTGTITRDIASPHHDPITQQTAGTGSFTWVTLPSGLPCLKFNTPAGGNGEYLECDVADTLDLDFTTEDYSFVAWINWEDTGVSEMIVGRYQLDVEGYEIYLYGSGGMDYLTQRHNHASLAPAPVRTACYSKGWTPDTWWLLGITRSGLYPRHYRNGVALPMSYSDGGVQNPDSSTRDLLFGTRFDKSTNWYGGYMSNPRFVGAELTAYQMRYIFESEKHWFGV